MPSGYSAVIYRPVITVVCAQQAVHRSETVIKCSAKMPKQEKRKRKMKIMIIRHPCMLCVYMEQLNKCSKKM